MPEVLEVELTRRAIGLLVGRRLAAVERTDPIVVADGVDAAVPGATVEALGRRGKLLVMHTDQADVGVHLGMTGRLVVDDDFAIGRLAYGSASDDAIWDRWVVALDDGRRLRLHDPRRLGRVWLDPAPERLGPDALALTRSQLAAALRDRRAPLKAVLLDQYRIAGLGNLLVDEVLWRTGLDPRRPAPRSLAPAEVARLQATIRRRLPAMMANGGSHTGTISPDLRRDLPSCPRCRGALARTTVGGRTTVWCPAHQH